VIGAGALPLRRISTAGLSFRRSGDGET
jgi:hypothetical protein